MPYSNLQPGLGNVGSYQVAGRPWITGSSIPPSGTITVEFPSVTKAVTIIAAPGSFAGEHNDTYTGSLAVYFGPAPTEDWDGTNIVQIVNNHYLCLMDPEDAFTFDVKCKTMHITCLGFGNPSTPTLYQGSDVHGSFRIIAELTSIERDNMYTLHGSGIDE